MMAGATELASRAAELASDLVHGRVSFTRADASLRWCEALAMLNELQRCYFGGGDPRQIVARLARIADDLGDPVISQFVEREVAVADLVPPPEGHAWFEEPVADIPTMSTRDVLRFYHWFARTVPLGGAVVELGCWYGASTVQLARGIAARTDGPWPRVFAVDTFRYAAWMTSYDPDVTVGDSFLPRFRAYCAEFGNRVSPIEADTVSDASWSRAIRGPVGMIVYDVDRSRTSLEHALAALRPNLVIGTTVLVVATFGHLAAQTVREWAREHHDQLRPLPVPKGPLRAFRITGAIT